MVALVTGGGRGIGQGIALRLAKHGWRVAVAARSSDQLAETVNLAVAGNTIAVPADVSDPASIKTLARTVEDKLGSVDLLVNNAAVGGPFGLFWENDPDEWWRAQEVNVRGPMLLCRALLPGMIARRAGRIINIVSGAGCQAFPEMSAYVISKTALVRLSEQLAVELKPYGMGVFAVRPGVVRTAMLEEARPHFPFIEKYLNDGIDVTPDVVAHLVLTLASGVADSLSGHFFSVGENTDEIIRRAEEVRSGDLYLLRGRTLR